MRRWLAIFLVTLPLFAQHRESIDVNVLELDVVVLDRDGKPVDGLTRDDFDVAIGKRKAEVTNFYAVRRGAIVDEMPTTAAVEKAPGETMLPTMVVIVIDDTRLGQHAKQRALEALEQYVAANVGPAVTAMLVRWNGSLDVRIRPTERAGPLIAELQAMANEPAMPPASDRQTILKAIDDAMLGITGTRHAHNVQNAWIQLIGYADRESHDVEKTLKALHEVTKLAGAFEGRKALLYLSEGLPLQPAADLFEYWERMTRTQGLPNLNAHLMENIAKDTFRTVNPLSYDRSRQFAELARQAQAMKVNFYAVDAGGVRGFDRGGLDEMQRVAEVSTINLRANLQDGVRMVANETGGRFIANENDLARALTVMSEQFNTFYSLGVRAKVSTDLEKVTVTVKSRPEVRVVTARHRRPLTRAEQIERAVRSRLYLRAAENPHAAELTAGTAATIDGRCMLPLSISTPRTEPVDLHFALLDERYQESDVRKARVQSPHLLTIGLKPGKYRLSLALDDPSTGETSYLQREVDASNCR